MTCSTVSSSVAPGQFAWTTIVRKVNGGSSLRPRVEYETAPATMDAIITKMMNDLWLSAQEDRLTPIYEASFSSRTFWPGRNACTPAVTTVSPGARPSPTTTEPGSCRRMLMLRSDTVEVARSTTQMAGLPPEVISAEAGMTTSCSPASCMRPDTTEPSSMPGGGTGEPDADRERARDRIGLRRDLADSPGRGDARVLGQGHLDRGLPRGGTQHLRGNLEHGVGAAGARDAQDHLAALHDFASLGAARGHRPVELGREHREPDEVLRHLDLRLGTLDLRLGRAERGEGRIEVGPGGEPLADQRLLALQRIARTDQLRARRVERRLRAEQLVALVHLLEPRQHLPLADPVADVDGPLDQAARDTERDGSLVLGRDAPGQHHDVTGVPPLDVDRVDRPGVRLSGHLLRALAGGQGRARGERHGER